MCSVPSSSFRLSPLGGIFCESAERGAAGNSTSAAASVAAAAELEEGGGRTGWWKEGGQFAEDCVSTRRNESEAKQRQGETVQKKVQKFRRESK